MVPELLKGNSTIEAFVLVAGVGTFDNRRHNRMQYKTLYF